MESRPERELLQLPWRKAIWSSATSTLNLVVVGSAALGATLLQSLPVLAIGGVTYLALIAWDLASREPGVERSRASLSNQKGSRVLPC